MVRPRPLLTAPFVGVAEIACGLLLILSVFTRPAAIPRIIDVLVAISTTKVPILAKSDLWTMAHEARTDYCMLLGSVFLFLTGSGRLSLEARIRGSRERDG